jgi:hypothetical protein
MLVTFSCPAYADITMFGNVAMGLLKIMGQSDALPSALLAEDVQAALERLEAAVGAGEPRPGPTKSPKAPDAEPAVSLRHRALPLMALLKAAAKEQCNVMWDRNH